jgi:hypothetical protein
LSHRFERLDWERPRIRQTAVWKLRRICRGVVAGKAGGVPHTGSLSTLLRDSWRLLRWLLAPEPPGLKRRVACTRSPDAYPDIHADYAFVDEEGTPADLAKMKLFFRVI